MEADRNFADGFYGRGSSSLSSVQIASVTITVSHKLYYFRIVASQIPPPNSTFLAPRHWPTWAAIVLLFIVAWLPIGVRLYIGKLLGLATYKLARERRYITRVNIALCFPKLDADAQEDLVIRSFIENGKGLIETATGWVRPPQHFSELIAYSGAQHMDEALAKGKGVLLLGAHYTTLDFTANLLALRYPIAVTYRAHNNPLFDAFMLRGRLRNCTGVFERNDLRGPVKHLRQGKILWYAPDQDYGPSQAVYAPFFGQDAATITTASRFAAINNSSVLLLRHHRMRHKPIYVIEFIPVPAPFPSDDEVADATLINHMLEYAIKFDPSQYLWMHKRFKTQRGGKPDSPYINISTPNKKLSEQQYQSLLTAAEVLSGSTSSTQKIQLQTGLQLWTMPGLATGWNKVKHPALNLDKLSKLLRSKGITTITVDNIFRIESRKITAISCFVPKGLPLCTLDKQQVHAAQAAEFFARLHSAQLYCLHVNTDNILLQNTELAVLDPSRLHILPKSNAALECVRDLLQFCAAQHYSDAQLQSCVNYYLAAVPTPKREELAQLLAEQSTDAHNVDKRIPTPTTSQSAKPEA